MSEMPKRDRKALLGGTPRGLLGLKAYQASVEARPEGFNRWRAR